MKIFIQVKTNKKENKVEKIDENNYQVFVKAPAKEGKANAAVIKILAQHFGVAKSKITIKSGLKSKQKIIQIKKESPTF
jgi:hypothetical protein